MDITHNQIDLGSQMYAIDMTSNIENPKYKLLNLKVKEQTECLSFDSDILSIVVICGILDVEINDNITRSYSELEGFHIKSDLKRIKISGQNNCEILIGSTADLIISTNENKEKLTDEILDFSNYKVSKPWGWEIWFTQNIGNTPYALKNIHMEKGFQSSLQSHKFKSETNIVIEGEAEVLYGQQAPSDETESIDLTTLNRKIYKKFDGWSNKVNELHRVIAYKTYDAIEISTPELDDVIRWDDDNNRQSGHIESEHSS
tara:strand:- start:974 stop:1750 length:777 start_codon:yes stop_codon:yes gene_type:complete